MFERDLAWILPASVNCAHWGLGSYATCNGTSEGSHHAEPVNHFTTTWWQHSGPALCSTRSCSDALGTPNGDGNERPTALGKWYAKFRLLWCLHAVTLSHLLFAWWWLLLLDLSSPSLHASCCTHLPHNLAWLHCQKSCPGVGVSFFEMGKWCYILKIYVLMLNTGLKWGWGFFFTV